MSTRIIIFLCIVLSYPSLYAISFGNTSARILELYEEDMGWGDVFDAYVYRFNLEVNYPNTMIDVDIWQENISTTWINVETGIHFTGGPFSDNLANQFNEIELNGDFDLLGDPEIPLKSIITIKADYTSDSLQLIIHWNQKRPRTAWEYVDGKRIWNVDREMILQDGVPHFSARTEFVTTTNGSGKSKTYFELKRIENFSQELIDKNWSASFLTYSHESAIIPDRDTLEGLVLGDTAFVEVNFFMTSYPEANLYEGYGNGTIAFEIWDRFDESDDRRVDTLVYNFCWQPTNDECFGVTSKELVGTDHGVRLYPNPTSSYFQIEVDEKWLKERGQLSIFNSLGKKVRQFSLSQTHTSLKAPKERGLYLIELSNAQGERLTKKLYVNY